MPDSMVLDIQLSGSLKQHVEREIRVGGYENAAEYVRDLLRQQMRAKEADYRELKAHLENALAAPESDYEELTAQDIYDRVEGHVSA